MNQRAQTIALAIVILVLPAVSVLGEPSATNNAGSVEAVQSRLSQLVPENLRKGLILYYSFDQDEGSKVTDLSGKGKQGKVSGAKYIEDEDAGGAMSFDGEADYIGVPDINLEDFTFAAWVKPTEGIGLGGRLVFLLKNGRHSFGLHGDREHSIRVAADNDDLDDWRSIGNRWTHVTVTHQGRTFKLYLNGEAVGTKDMGAESIAGTLYIGGDPNHKEGWHGLIDEVALYNRPLTEEEIKLLYDTTDFQGQEPPFTVSSGAIQDVRCFLRSDKPKWKANEIPTFKADIKDLPINGLSLVVGPSQGCQIEFDGLWYRWSGPEWLGVGDARAGWMAKHGAYLRFSLAEWLWLSATGGAALNLTPGKHTVRLAWAGYYRTPRQERPIKLLSNPVQIEILPPKGEARKLTPHDKHRRQVVYAFHSSVRPVSLTQADRARGLGVDLASFSESYPAFGWDDIPLLLELAESKREMESTPSLSISSYAGGPCFEGMVALWLVEGLRRRQLELVRQTQTGEPAHRGSYRRYYHFPLNAICRTENGEDGQSTELPRRSRRGAVGALESWWERARSDCGLVHRKVVQAYQNWWRMVGSLPAEEAAAFYPLDLTDIRWFGGGRHDEPLEIYDKITPEDTVAHKTVYGHERQSLRTVYYTLKRLKSAKDKPSKVFEKATCRREMLAVQKIVLYFYDHNGNIVRTKSIYPSSAQLRPGM